MNSQRLKQNTYVVFLLMIVSNFICLALIGRLESCTLCIQQNYNIFVFCFVLVAHCCYTLATAIKILDGVLKLQITQNQVDVIAKAEFAT